MPVESWCLHSTSKQRVHEHIFSAWKAQSAGLFRHAQLAENPQSEPENHRILEVLISFLTLPYLLINFRDNDWILLLNSVGRHSGGLDLLGKTRQFCVNLTDFPGMCS